MSWAPKLLHHFSSQNTFAHVQKRMWAACGRFSSDHRHQLRSISTSERESEKAHQILCLQRQGGKKKPLFVFYLENKPRGDKSLILTIRVLVVYKWEMSVKKTERFNKDKLAVALIEWYNNKVSFHFVISLMRCVFVMLRHLSSQPSAWHIASIQ